VQQWGNYREIFGAFFYRPSGEKEASIVRKYENIPTIRYRKKRGENEVEMRNSASNLTSLEGRRPPNPMLLGKVFDAKKRKRRVECE
jgi:hypothetical protein